MRLEERHSVSRGWGPWGRGVALLVVAALAAPLVPKPVTASPIPCHMEAPAPSVHHGHQQDAAPCDHCGQSPCLAMTGCAHVVALAVAPAPAPRAPQDSQLTEPDPALSRDLASRGPPTPPPNS